MDYVCGLLKQFREYLQLTYLRWWRKGFACPQAAVRVAGYFKLAKLSLHPCISAKKLFMLLKMR